MRPIKQARVISSQLEILEEFKTQLDSLFQLDSLLELTNHAIHKGNSWIEETNNQTFLEVYKFLTDETVFVNRFLSDYNEDCHQHSGLQEKEMMKTKSSDTLKTSKPPGLDLKVSKEYKQLLEKCQEMDRTISLQSKKLLKLELKFQEHKNDKKKSLFRERKEIEKKYKLKFDELMDQLLKASNFMSRLQTLNENVTHQVKEHDKQISSFIETLHDVQKQILDLGQKFETSTKHQKNTEKCFSLRLEEVMIGVTGITESSDELKYDSDLLFSRVNEHVECYDATILMLQGKLKELNEHVKSLDRTCNKETEGTKRKRYDSPTKKSTDPDDKNFIVSSQVDMSKKRSLSRQQAFFFAQAAGELNVPMDLRQGQIVTSFGRVLENIGNHYEPTKGIFTAPCDGLYLCSLTLRFEMGENVIFGVALKSSCIKKSMICYAQTSEINSSVSVTSPMRLKQNDQVYISSKKDCTQIKLHGCSYFMCALIYTT